MSLIHKPKGLAALMLFYATLPAMFVDVLFHKKGERVGDKVVETWNENKSGPLDGKD